MEQWEQFMDTKELARLMILIDKNTVTPSYENILRVFTELKPSDVRVVILGQDPYPTANTAIGLSFAVSEQSKIPQSLRNMIIEMGRTHDVTINCDNIDSYKTLSHLVDQGVMLLNTVLTTDIGKSNAHKYMGWQSFIIDTMRSFNTKYPNVVYLCLGNQASDMVAKIKNVANVVQVGHPSPLNRKRDFAHSGCFTKVNEELSKHGHKHIRWC